MNRQDKGRRQPEEEEQQQQQRRRRPETETETESADMVTDANPYTRPHPHRLAEAMAPAGPSGSARRPVLADQTRGTASSSGARRKEEAGQEERLMRTLRSGEEDERSSSSEEEEEEEFFEADEEESEDLGDRTNRTLQITEAVVSNQRSSPPRRQRNIRINTVQVEAGLPDGTFSAYP